MKLNNENLSKTRPKAYAYTPGLKIKRNVKVLKERKIPIKGKALVNVGDKISHDKIIAEGYVPGDPIVINAPFDLDCDPKIVSEKMIKKRLNSENRNSN